MYSRCSALRSRTLACAITSICGAVLGAVFFKSFVALATAPLFQGGHGEAEGGDLLIIVNHLIIAISGSDNFFLCALVPLPLIFHLLSCILNPDY